MYGHKGHMHTTDGRVQTTNRRMYGTKALLYGDKVEGRRIWKVRHWAKTMRYYVRAVNWPKTKPQGS